MGSNGFKHPDGCCPMCGNRDLVIKVRSDDRCDVYLYCGQCGVSFKPNEIFDTVEEWTNSLLGKKYSEMVTREVKKELKENLESNEKEWVSHPDHYQSKFGIEVIDVIVAFTEDLTGVEAFDTGNIIKYACRWNKKENPIQDLEKVVWYTQHLIDYLKDKGM